MVATPTYQNFTETQTAFWEIISTLFLWFKCGLSQHEPCWGLIGVVHSLRDASGFRVNYILQEHVVLIGSPFGLLYSLWMQCYLAGDDSAMEPLPNACGTLLGSASHPKCEPNNHFSLHNIRCFATVALNGLRPLCSWILLPDFIVTAFVEHVLLKSVNLVHSFSWYCLGINI